MVTDIISAVNQIDVSSDIYSEVAEMKEQVLQDLEMIDFEVGLAMSILYEATSDVDVEVLQDLEQFDARDEVLSHLDNALSLCREISFLLCFMQGGTSVYVDIKPGSCPNPLNLKSKGVLPVAVLGAEEFDVTTIDPVTIRLSPEGIEEGVSPIRWSYKDVATPFEGVLCDCHDLNGDGYLDLTLKFKTQELVETLYLDEFAEQTIPLILTGNLKEGEGGTPIRGVDCIFR